MKEKFEELAKGEVEAAAVDAVLVGEVIVSDSSSSWTLAMLGERPELKPPKGPEPPGKVDSAIVEIIQRLYCMSEDYRKRCQRDCSAFNDGRLQVK